MGIVNFSIPKELVERIVKEIKIDNFIETGTYLGETTFWAASHFKNVFTIEIDPVISKRTSSREDRPQNIEFLIGNSKDVLPKIVGQLSGRSFFWLDGHWCLGAGGKDEECPLMDEIVSISKTEESIIFIDDARCFLGPLPPPHDSNHWPSIDEIFSLLKGEFPQHRTTIIDDVIICCPKDVKLVIDSYWQETFFDRFHKNEDTITLNNFSKKQIVKHLLKI